MREHLAGFTIDRLFRTLMALGQHIEIIVHGNAEQRSGRLIASIDSIPA